MDELAAHATIEKDVARHPPGGALQDGPPVLSAAEPSTSAAAGHGLGSSVQDVGSSPAPVAPPWIGGEVYSSDGKEPDGLRGEGAP